MRNTGSGISKMASLTRKAAVTTAAIPIELLDSDDGDDDYMEVLLAHIVNGTQVERAKIYGYVEEVVPEYTDDIFRRLFRMSRDTFVMVVDFISECPEWQSNHTGGYKVTDISKQVLITLWYLAGTDTIQKIADRFGISEATVIESRKRIIDIIVHKLKKRFIKWPHQADMAEQADIFAARNGFPGIIGALDGTHIKISKPKDHPQSYYNRKNFYSIQLQAVCLHDMRFSHVFTGFPGKVHDARVLQRSDLWKDGLQLCNMIHCILADGAYPLRRWLLTPYRNNGHLGEKEQRYNHYHSANRVVIERAFGLLKGRFRRLHHLHTQDIKTSCEVIMACCVLHNICILQKDEVNDFLEGEENDDQPLNNPHHGFAENDIEGVVKRNFIANNFV